MYKHPEINYQPQHPLLNKFSNSNVRRKVLWKPPYDDGSNPELTKARKESQDLWKQERVMAQHQPRKCKGIGHGDWCPMGKSKKWEKWIKDYIAIKKKAQQSARKLKAMELTAK